MANTLIGKFVVVRTYSAGVHCGTLVSADGEKVTLSDARRIWRWKGANSLNEVATSGVAEGYTRISQPVETLCLTNAIEIIKATESGKANLTRSRWGNEQD